MASVRPGSTRGWPIPGSAGEKHLGFGGAALTTSLAAHIRVCLPFGIVRARVLRIAAMSLFISAAALGHTPHPEALPRLHFSSFDSTDSPKVSSSADTLSPQEQQPRQG